MDSVVEYNWFTVCLPVISALHFAGRCFREVDTERANDANTFIDCIEDVDYSSSHWIFLFSLLLTANHVVRAHG